MDDFFLSLVLYDDSGMFPSVPFAGLEKTIDTALNSITVELIRKYFRKVREYQRAYRDGNTIGKEMQKTLKKI